MVSQGVCYYLIKTTRLTGVETFFFCFGVQNLCFYKSQTIIPRPINSEIENWKPDQIYFFSSFTVFLFNITDTNCTVNSNKKTAQKKKKKILIKKKTEKELKRIVVQKKRTKENHLLFRLLSTTAIVMGTSMSHLSDAIFSDHHKLIATLS